MTAQQQVCCNFRGNCRCDSAASAAHTHYPYKGVCAAAARALRVLATGSLTRDPVEPSSAGKLYATALLRRKPPQRLRPPPSQRTCRSW
jgi:hypothetical protein